jgi:hypothetical protein
MRQSFQERHEHILFCLSIKGMRNAYKILVGKPEGKRPLGRPRRRRKDNMRMDLREMGWEGVYWLLLA